MKKASLVVYDGPDAAGKSTQANLLLEHLTFDAGLKACLAKFPFNDRVTRPIIYWALFNGLARRFPTAFQLLQFVNKLLFQLFFLPWAMLKYDVVIFDRWVMSSRVYGDADGASRFVTRTMNRLLVRPDATVVITGPIRKRSRRQDSYEADEAYQGRVIDAYRIEAQADDVVHVSADLQADELARWIASKLWMDHGIPWFKASCECVCEGSVEQAELTKQYVWDGNPRPMSIEQLKALGVEINAD